MSTFSELIDFTRSSTGTYLDSVVYGDELVTNGTFDSDSDWTTAQATIANGVLNVTGGARFAVQNLGLVVGNYYHVSFDYTETSSSSLRVNTGTTNAEQEALVTLTNNTNSGTAQGIVKAIGPNIAIEAKGALFTGTIDNVSVKKVISTAGGTPLLRTADTNEPRLEYDASGQPLGLLIEEQRTNLVTQSTFNSGWTGGGIILTNNVEESPDGSYNASKLVWTATTTYHSTFVTINVNANTTYTRSVYIKYAGVQWIHLQQYDAGGAQTNLGVWFDIKNGIKGSEQSGVTGEIEDVGNGWYRCSATSQTSTGTTSERVQISLTSANGVSAGGQTGDGVSGIYLYGAQLEQGAFPTSYIPTSGSTVTRNSDLAPIPVERFAFDASEGTLFVHAVTAAGLNTTTGQCAVSMSSGATANCYRLRKNVSTEQIGMLKRVGDSNVININGKIVGETSTFKACGNYSATDLNLSIDGEDVITGSASSSTITITKLEVGTSPFGDADCFNGHIKRIQYFPKRLSNDELVELTKPSSSPTMSLTFDGQATSELVEGLHD